MKKVLIGVLILIPIIIVASVLLTTNIISKNSYLPVDRVELNENYIEFCCFVNRFLRDFKKFSKLFLFSGF